MVKNPRIWAAQQFNASLICMRPCLEKKMEKVEEEEKKMKKGGAPRPLTGHHACTEHTPCPLSFIFPLPEERESGHHMFCVYLPGHELSSSPGSEHQKMPGLNPAPVRSADAQMEPPGRLHVCMLFLNLLSWLYLIHLALHLSISVLHKIYRHLGNTCLANL